MRTKVAVVREGAAGLTDAEIKALKPRATRYDVADTGTAGLTLRVWPTGAKRWSVWYRKVDGTTRRLSLGRYGAKPPAWSLARARKRARQVNADVQRGADPQGEKQAARAAGRARRKAKKLSDLLDDFVGDQSPRWRPATLAGWQRYIKADIKPHLGRRIPSEITADDVVRFLETLKRERGPVSVARAFEVVRRAFKWAVATRRLSTNPCSGLEAKELVARARTSDRVFDDVELVAILAGAATTEMRLLVPWVLYTGARGGEARSAEWKDIDRKAKLWTVPADKSKNRERHRVPLSRGALAVLDELDDSSRWLFPAPTAEGFMDRSQKVVEKVRAVSGIEDFGLHHARRTLRQRLTDADVSVHVAEAVLGHVPPRIVRTYSPSWEPLREMATALEAWGRELQRIARGEEQRAAHVVPMVRA